MFEPPLLSLGPRVGEFGIDEDFRRNGFRIRSRTAEVAAVVTLVWPLMLDSEARLAGETSA